MWDLIVFIAYRVHTKYSQVDVTKRLEFFIDRIIKCTYLRQMLASFISRHFDIYLFLGMNICMHNTGSLLNRGGQGDRFYCILFSNFAVTCLSHNFSKFVFSVRSAEGKG